MSTKRLQKKKAAMQAKKEQQLKKNTVAAICLPFSVKQF